MRIVFLDASTLAIGSDIDFSCFERLGEYVPYDRTSEAQTVERAAGAQVVITNKVLMTDQIMGALPDLKLIAVIATGYNVVDTAAARACGVKVANVAAYAINTVPQHTFALILNLVTKAHLYDRDVREGKWQRSEMFGLLTYGVFELAGKTLGIVGLGAIGSGVARIAEGFRMKVLANDIRDLSDTGYANTPLDELLATSDIVTMHCPLTEKTRHLIDSDQIARMKPGALLINTARGGIIEEKALASALRDGGLAGAATDVLSIEPPRDGNPLLDAPNMILTPHTAWSAVEARQRLVDETAENIREFQAGCDRNIVN
ncbi:MAG: glycerate dehydrogenase [Phycisphaeraceae bacterium]|nr:glycerate dehydrogenase [Phycisphaeraceae bacterium]